MPLLIRSLRSISLAFSSLEKPILIGILSTTARTMSYINKQAPGVDQFFPANEPTIGSAYSKARINSVS